MPLSHPPDYFYTTALSPNSSGYLIFATSTPYVFPLSWWSTGSDTSGPQNYSSKFHPACSTGYVLYWYNQNPALPFAASRYSIWSGHLSHYWQLNCLLAIPTRPELYYLIQIMNDLSALFTDPAWQRMIDMPSCQMFLWLISLLKSISSDEFLIVIFVPQYFMILCQVSCRRDHRHDRSGYAMFLILPWFPDAPFSS